MNAVIKQSATQRQESFAVYALFSVMLVDSFSYSMILSILPYVVLGDGGGVSSGGFLVSVHAIFSMVSAPILGRLSDRIGRKNIILFTLGIEVLSYVLFAFSRNLPELFVARALAGISAGNVGVLRAALADVTTHQRRGQAMAKLSVAWALGFILGPALTMVLPKHAIHPTLLPGIIAVLAGSVSLGFIATLYGVGSPSAAGPVRSGTSNEESEEASAPIGRNEILTQVAFMALCQTGLVAMTGFFVTLTLKWDQRQLSLLMLGSAVVIIAAQALLVPSLLRRLGETGAVLISMFIAALCVAPLSVLAPSSWLVWAMVPFLFAFITVNQTVMTTLLSNITVSHKQGVVLGLASSAGAVGRIVGPSALAILFDKFSPRAPYGAALIIMTCMSAWLAMRSSARLPSIRPASNSIEID